MAGSGRVCRSGFFCRSCGSFPVAHGNSWLPYGNWAHPSTHRSQFMILEVPREVKGNCGPSAIGLNTSLPTALLGRRAGQPGAARVFITHRIGRPLCLENPRPKGRMLFLCPAPRSPPTATEHSRYGSPRPAEMAPFLAAANMPRSSRAISGSTPHHGSSPSQNSAFCCEWQE
jgi:hypothetical protein